MHSQSPRYYVPWSILRVPLPAGIGLALRNLLYVAALSRKAVLRVLLAMQCYSCRYGIVCPSYGLYGSISICYKAGLCVSGCMRTYAYNLTIIRLKLQSTTFFLFPLKEDFGHNNHVMLKPNIMKK